MNYRHMYTYMYQLDEWVNIWTEKVLKLWIYEGKNWAKLFI